MINFWGQVSSFYSNIFEEKCENPSHYSPEGKEKQMVGLHTSTH